MTDPVSHRGSLFLSYARHDDEAFVARLHDDLAAHGFSLWWDRRCMPNRGLTFLHEIRDAIAGVQRLLFVFGPNAAQSDYVRAEWQYACSIGTPVITVLRLGDYEGLMEALRHSDVLDFRRDEHYAERLAILVRQLDQSVAPLGRLIGVPELPPQFQARTTDMTMVRAALLRDSHEPVVLTAAGRRVGMQGMGGIGKSVLAAAVVREFDVRRAFPDGLLWMAMGPNPDMPLRLAEACRALGDVHRSFVDAAQGRARLGELLADRASLLVLDDVWQLEHVNAFDALGPRCGLFVTTRDERLLDELGAIKHSLDVLTPDAALRLMAAWLGTPEASMPEDAELVARECGYLPLALALAAAQVRDGVAWGSVLEALQEADLQYLDSPNGSVFRSIRVSVDALEREDPRFARHYIDLTVFSEGATIPEAAVMTLWTRAGGLNARTADKLIAMLGRRALIRTSGQSPHRTIQLHDLQHDFARAAAGDLRGLHAALLDAYRKQFDGDWAHGPNDGYFFQHLAFHFVGAERFDELYALLTASPDWMEAQFRACSGDSQFAADIELAQRTPAGDGNVARIGLITARQVINSRVEAYSDNDLETLARLGRSAEALSYARLRRDPSQRIQVLVRLHLVLRDTGQLHEDLLTEALTLVSQLKLEDYRVGRGLSDLCLALFEANRAGEALGVANLANRNMSWHYYANNLVAALEQQQRFTDAAAVARTIHDDRSRVQALLRIARAARSAGISVLSRALIIEAASDVRAANDPEPTSSSYVNPWRSESFQEAAELLGTADAKSVELWKEAIDLILRREGFRETELKEIAIKLARIGETELVLRAISGSSSPGVFRQQQAPQIARAAVASARFDTALAVVEIMDEPSLQAQALASMFLPMHNAGDARIETVISAAVAFADRIKAGTQIGRLSAYGSVRAQTLCMIVNILSGLSHSRVAEILQSALLDARRSTDDRSHRAEALAAVAGTILRTESVETAHALLDEALHLATEGRGSFFNLADIMAGLGDFDRALFAASQVKPPDNQSSALRGVAEKFAKSGQSDYARRVVAYMDNGNARDSTLGDIAKALAPHNANAARVFFEEAMANRSWPLAFILLNLARVPECWTIGLIEHALSCVPLVDDPKYRLECLQGVLPELVSRRWTSLCEKVVETARALDLLAALASDFAKECERAINLADFETSLLLARNVTEEEKHSQLFARIAMAMSEAGDSRALEIARSSTGESRTRALETVARARARAGDQDAAAILDERLAEKKDNCDVAGQDAATRRVARALAAHGDLDAALIALRSITDERARITTLADIAFAFVVAGRLAEVVQLAGSMSHPLMCARGLLILAGVSSDRLLFERALAESHLRYPVMQDVSADWIAALCALAERYSTEEGNLARRLLSEARAAYSRIADEGHRSAQQEFVVQSFARIGWFDDALKLARAVEDGGENNFGRRRAAAVGFVADGLARAGREAEARAAATEADQISLEVLGRLLSIAPFTPPEDFGSEHQRRIDAILAARNVPEPETTPNTPTPATGDSLLTTLTETAGLGLAPLKEATRIAGWVSPSWRRISESIRDK